MWRAFKSIFDPLRGYLYKVVKAPLPFSPRRRTTRVVLVTRINKHRRKFISVSNKPFIDTCQHLNCKGSIARRPNQQKYTLSRDSKDCKADGTTWKLTLQDINTTPKEPKTERGRRRRQLFRHFCGSLVRRNEQRSSAEKYPLTLF